MKNSIFYSWQSDRPNTVCRGFVKRALEAAIQQLNAELDEALRPEDESLELDHDTKGLPGSPDIAEAILRKIESARAFVADVTPIGMSDVDDGVRAKHLPNPNVMIELGYAKKALGTDHIIQIWKSAFTGCGPLDLPFDMRGKRGPITYSLPEDASVEERKKALPGVTSQLKMALEAILAAGPTVVTPDKWATSQDGDHSIWPHSSDGIKINEPDHGSGTKRVFPPPRSFVRILPAAWSGSDDLDRHDLLLGMNGGMSWGATRGGVLSYPGSVVYSDSEKVHALTKRFPETGELWATRTDIASKFGEHICIRGDAIPEHWASYLRYAVPHVAEGGGLFPFQIRLGVVGLGDLHWPDDTGFGTKPHVALQDDLELDFTLTSAEPANLWDSILEAWVAYRRVFSLPHPSMPEQQRVRSFLNVM